MSLPDQLDTLFAADRASRQAEARLLAHEDTDALRDALTEAVDEAVELDDAVEANIRLTRLARGLSVGGDLSITQNGMLPQALVDALVEYLRTKLGRTDGLGGIVNSSPNGG